jgi:hypothetical protein
VLAVGPSVPHLRPDWRGHGPDSGGAAPADLVRVGPSTGPASAGERPTWRVAGVSARRAVHPGPAVAVATDTPQLSRLVRTALVLRRPDWHVGSQCGGPRPGTRRRCRPNTANVVLGDPAGEVAVPALPHRLRPGARRSAPRWRYSPAIRPPEEPEWRPGSPQHAARSVAHGAPPGRRPAAPPPARSGGRVRWRRRVPHPGCVVPGGAPPPSRCGGPVAMTVAHRDRARCGGRERWRWFLARAGARPSTRAAPPGRQAAGTSGGGDGVERRRSRSAAGLHPLARPSLLPRRPA